MNELGNELEVRWVLQSYLHATEATCASRRCMVGNNSTYGSIVCMPCADCARLSLVSTTSLVCFPHCMMLLAAPPPMGKYSIQGNGLVIQYYTILYYVTGLHMIAPLLNLRHYTVAVGFGFPPTSPSCMCCLTVELAFGSKVSHSRMVPLDNRAHRQVTW